MANVFCPYCGEKIRFAPRLYGMPYCRKCGWKLEEAEVASRQAALILLVISVLGLGFLYRTIVLGWPLAVNFIYLVCFGLFPATLGVLSWFDYQKIVEAEPQTVPPRPEDWEARSATEYRPYLNLAIPRRIAISWKGWVRVFIGVVSLGLALYLVMPGASADFWTESFQQLKADTIPVAVLLVIGGWANLNLLRQRWSHVPLFRSGNVAIGRVRQQQFQKIQIGIDMIGRYSLIQYEFHDRKGNPNSNCGHDYSKSLYQEMPALIFYFESDPLNNVALGCSLYEIRIR